MMKGVGGSWVFVSLALFGVAGNIAKASNPCVNDWPNPDECFPDVICDQFSQYAHLASSVVHIFGPDIGAQGGAFGGSGVLINNVHCDPHSAEYGADASCGAPYILTAAHLATTGGQLTQGAINTLQTETYFTFGLEAGVCGGPVSNGAVAMVGAEVVAYSVARDVMLLKLATSLPAELEATYVGWCAGPTQQAVSISHPCGATKRIAISQFGGVSLIDLPLNTGLQKIHRIDYWDQGAVTGGSSGSPLLDAATGHLKGIYVSSDWGGDGRWSMRPVS